MNQAKQDGLYNKASETILNAPMPPSLINGQQPSMRSNGEQAPQADGVTLQ